MQVKKQQLEPDIEQMNWFKIGKGVHQGCILSPCLFNLYVPHLFNLYAEFYVKYWVG